MTAFVLALIAQVAALVVLMGSADAAAEQKRVALVFGNATYQHAAKLSNPVNDATAMAQMFKDIGFSSVTMRQDVGVQDFKRALRDFFDAAQDADIAVVYYAGHGVQVGDMNYMIPVDARLATEIDVQDETVSLDRILMALQPAKRLRLVILDACRENPFLSRMRVSQASRSIGRGLARVEPENNSLIAYAAKNGQIAQDGTGNHSPFTMALLKHLPAPGLDIRLALGRVRDDVLKSTSNKQEPFVYGSLGGESISLAPAPAEPKPEALAAVKSDYALAERIGTQKAWEAFLANHKQGLYAELARAQLAKLQRDGKAAASTVTSNAQTPALVPAEAVAPPKPSMTTNKERADWDRIKDAGDRAQVRDFITRYPSSPLAETARNRLQGLDRAAREREEKARAEQQAAPRPEEPRVAKAGDNGEACSRDQQKLDLLRAYTSQGWAREDLKRLKRTTPCERVRAEAGALLPGTPDVPQLTAPPQQEQQPPGNALNPALSAIAELRRLGCVAGQADPAQNELVRNAIKSYLAEKGRSDGDVKVVESLLADLKAENKRLCATAAQAQ